MTFKGLHIYTGDRLQWMARQQASRPLQYKYFLKFYENVFDEFDN